MKTINKISIGFLLLVCLLNSKTVMAQLPCNYNFNNGTQCNLTVQVDYYGGSGCTLCYSSGPTACAPGTTPFNCGTCSGICDIVVTITSVGTVSMNSTTASGTAPCTVLSGCPSPYKVDVLWNTTDTSIGCAP